MTDHHGTKRGLHPYHPRYRALARTWLAAVPLLVGLCAIPAVAGDLPAGVTVDGPKVKADAKLYELKKVQVAGSDVLLIFHKGKPHTRANVVAAGEACSPGASGGPVWFQVIADEAICESTPSCQWHRVRGEPLRRVVNAYGGITDADPWSAGHCL